MVAHQAVAAFFRSSSLDFEKLLEVLEELHLLSEVVSVVLDVLLVRSEVFNNHLLLPELGIEQFRVALVLVRQALVRLVDELRLVANPFEECIVDFSLNVIEVVFSLVVSVVVEGLLDVGLLLFLGLIEVLHNVIEVLLLLRVH